jgi:hypothetical protein
MRIEKIIELLSEGTESNIWADTGQQTTNQTADERTEQIIIEEVQFAMCKAVGLLRQIKSLVTRGEDGYPFVKTEHGSNVIDRREVVRTIALEIEAAANGDTDADYHKAKDSVMYSYHQHIEEYLESLRS